MVAISLSAIAFAGDAANVEAAQSVPPIPAQTWRMTEITLSSDRDYAKPLEAVMVTATFTSTGGVTIVRPVFWDGDRSWRVRFAAPSPGVWTMLTASSEPGDAGLHGVRRTLAVSPYPGDLPIYRHGFLKISSTGRYLAHADDTPFLWMSEDHACLDGERFDESNKPGTTSHFKHMAELRRKQQFTVYQSVIWTVSNWATPELPKLDYYRGLDRKYAYLADLGYVHSIALGYHKDLGDGQLDPAKLAAMRRIARYVEGRYGAYPMAYYTCGEFNIPADKDAQPELQGPEKTYNRHWWGQVASAIHENNSYGHPSSINYWQPQGTWFADQPFMRFWNLQAYSLRDHAYYGFWWKRQSPRPIIDSFSGMDHGTPASQRDQRAIAYVVMQSGGAGWGFLVEGIWNNCYTKDSGICAAQWGGTPWSTTIDWAGVTGLTHAYAFYMARPWWRLTPRFGDPAWADFADATRSPMTADDAGTVVVYFYGDGTKTGKLKRLPAVITQRASWYDPRSGAYTPIGPVTPAADGTWTIPQRPDAQDWVLLVEPTGSDQQALTNVAILSRPAGFTATAAVTNAETKGKK